MCALRPSTTTQCSPEASGEQGWHLFPKEEDNSLWWAALHSCGIQQVVCCLLGLLCGKQCVQEPLSDIPGRCSLPDTS